MALKKSELYSSLWASCDELRGGMDASQYNQTEMCSVATVAHNAEIYKWAKHFAYLARGGRLMR